MMFAKVLAAAVSIGAIGGASLAVAGNASTSAASPAPIMATQDAGWMQPISDTANAPVCEDVAFRVYFAPDEASLNSDARRTIAVAARDVRRCGRLDVSLAADVSRIDTAAERNLSSQRSVALLGEMRRHGVAGAVFVAPVSDVVVAAEDNAGPDFVEVTLAPSAGGQLLSSAANSRADM